MYQVVSEHSDFFVINKLPGVSIHNEDNAGLIQTLRSDFGLDVVYPVHRLDKPTSGLLVCAKNSQAASELSQLFQARRVEKYYVACSDKKPKKKQGAIVGDMVRTRNGNWKLATTQKNPAMTQFFSYGIAEISPFKRLFILKPHTGKTHQLRVALKSLGAPIAGDKRYSHSESNQAYDRTYLHAYALSFSYQGQDYSYQCLPAGRYIDDALIAFINEHLARPEDLSWPRLPAINHQKGDDLDED